MIDAEIYTQGDGKIVAFVMRGHGGRNFGYDIPCAQVSMLSQTAYLAVKRYLNREVVAENFEHGGLGVELKDAPDALTEAVLQTMLIGLKAVEKVAPKAVKVTLIAMDTAIEDNLQRKINRMNPAPSKPLPALKVADVRIRAEIFHGNGGNITGFNIGERKGKTVKEFEIYRAGVWSLVKATFSCVKDHLKRDFESKTTSRRVSLRLKDAPDDVTEAVFQNMLIGLREIQKIAPQIISVTENFSEVKLND